MSYVARPTADFRRRGGRDGSGYARFRSAYEQLDRSEEALVLRQSLDATYGEYEDLGTALIDRRDSQDAPLARLNRLTSRLDALVRSRALSPVDRADLIRAREIRTRLDAGLDDLLAAGPSPVARSGYRTLRASPRQAGTIGDGFLDRETTRRRDLVRFAALRQNLDGILDDGVQARSCAGVERAKDLAHAGVRRVHTILAAAIVGSLLLALAAIVLLRRGIALSVLRLSHRWRGSGPAISPTSFPPGATTRWARSPSHSTRWRSQGHSRVGGSSSKRLCSREREAPSSETAPGTISSGARRRVPQPACRRGGVCGGPARRWSGQIGRRAA